MNLKPSLFSLGKKIKRRSGVSPVISTVILIGVTVTLGLALWSYSVSQVNTSTETFASEVTDYVNYVNDRFVIVNLSFRHDEINESVFPAPFNISPFTVDGCPDDTQCVTMWIYNYGNLPVKVDGILFGPSGQEVDYPNCNDQPAGFNPNITHCFRPDLNPGNTDFQIEKKSIGKVTINYGNSITQDETYSVIVISSTHAQQKFFQGAD